MTQRSKVYQAVFVLALALLVYWSLPVSEPGQPDGDWQLVHLVGKTLIPGTNITISIENGRFNGFGGCNDFGGAYGPVNLSTLVFLEIEATGEACSKPDGVLDQENEFFLSLLSTRRFILSEGHLNLLDENSRTLLEFIPLLRYPAQPERLQSVIWQWITETDAVQKIERPAEIRFEAGRLAGFSGCRSFTGEYITDEDRINITYLQMVDGSCDSIEGQLIEQRFLDALDLIHQYHFSGANLLIELKTGEVFKFAPVNPETQLDAASAERVLGEFFDALVSGDYAAAGVLHSGPADFYITLRELNPGVDPLDRAALLASACQLQFRCMLPANIVDSGFLNDQAVKFTVTFQNPDGTPFKLDACCGGDQPESDAPTQFEYIVERTEKGLQVVGGLVYVP